MNPRIRRIHLCSVLTLVVFLAGCGSGGVNQGDFNIVSLEEEWALGNKLAGDIARQMQLVNDPTANSFVNEVGQRLVRQTEMAQLPWRFHIVADPEVNAFNIPGGHVYVTTGLIAKADNVAEFAGVMGHEISHGVSRHATEQLSKAYGLQMIAGLALGQNPAVYEQILAQVVGAGTLAKFGREAEREADQLGVRTMYQAGYDPRGMVTMFQELIALRKSSPSKIDRFFASHPLTEDRIRDVSKAIATLPAKSGLQMTDAGYDAFRRRVSGG